MFENAECSSLFQDVSSSLKEAAWNLQWSSVTGLIGRAVLNSPCPCARYVLPSVVWQSLILVEDASSWDNFTVRCEESWRVVKNREYQKDCPTSRISRHAMEALKSWSLSKSCHFRGAGASGDGDVLEEVLEASDSMVDSLCSKPTSVYIQYII